MKKIIETSLFTLLITILIFSDNKLFAKSKKAELDMFCGGLLVRTSGLISKNLYKFSGQAQSQLSRLDKHLLNNGTILLQRGYAGGAGKKELNTGLSWANRKVGNNIRVILKKGSSQNRTIKNCLSRY
tara:strand:- start:2995 stop:3378 length:384 start_codon:yes stop_codon:yes gene_type:complete